MRNYLIMLSSYFRQQFIFAFNVIFGTLSFLLANLLAFIPDEDGEFGFFKSSLYAMFLIVPNLAVYLKSLAKSNANALLPNFRIKNLKLTSVILFSIILLPSIFFVHEDKAYSNWMIWMSFISASTIFTILRFKENLLLILAIIWLGIFSYGILGLPTDIEFIASINNSYAFGGVEYILLVLSILLLYYSVRAYFNLKIEDNSETSLSNPWAADFDRSNDKVEKYIFNKVQNQKHIRHSEMLKIGLLLFGPTNLLYSRSALLLIGYLFGLYSIIPLFEGAKFSFADGFQNAILILYIISAVVTSVDFFQHRGNFAQLWMTGLFDTRKTQAKSLVKTYSLIMLKAFSHQTIFYVVIYFLFASESGVAFIPTILIGFSLMFIIMGFSLLFNNEVHTSEAKGWNVVFIFTTILIGSLIFIAELKLAYNQITFTSLGILLFVAGLLIYNGYITLSKSEFNFDMPDTQI